MSPLSNTISKEGCEHSVIAKWNYIFYAARLVASFILLIFGNLEEKEIQEVDI